MKQKEIVFQKNVSLPAAGELEDLDEMLPVELLHALSGFDPFHILLDEYADKLLQLVSRVATREYKQFGGVGLCNCFRHPETRDEAIQMHWQTKYGQGIVQYLVLEVLRV